MNEFVTINTEVLDAQITNLITAVNVLVVSHQEMEKRVAALEGNPTPDPAPDDQLTDEDGAPLTDENSAVLTGGSDAH